LALRVEMRTDQTALEPVLAGTRRSFRELLEQGFEVAVAWDATGAAQLPELDGIIGASDRMRDVCRAVEKIAMWDPPMRFNDTTRYYFEKLAGISSPEEAARYKGLFDPAIAPAISFSRCRSSAVRARPAALAVGHQRRDLGVRLRRRRRHRPTLGDRRLVLDRSGVLRDGDGLAHEGQSRARDRRDAHRSHDARARTALAARRSRPRPLT
jgi:hypothetical protein